MSAELPNLPPHVAEACYLATAECEGHSYETKIIRGRDLLKQYASYCWMDGIEDAPDDEVEHISRDLCDPNCWHVIGDKWATFTTEFEDGMLGFYLITDAEALRLLCV